MRAERETDGPIISRKDAQTTLVPFCIGKGGGGGECGGDTEDGRMKIKDNRVELRDNGLDAVGSVMS